MLSHTDSSNVSRRRHRQWLLVTTAATSALLLLMALSNTGGTRSEDPTSHRRDLQFGFLTSALETFIPFYRPNQYALQPPSSFRLTPLCTTSNSLAECTPANTLSFTTAINPALNEFRVQNSGPLQTQGVFWTIQEQLNNLFAFTEDISFANSDLVSWAQTRHGGGVNSGTLQTDGNGYEYVMRPLGDASWSISANSPEGYLTNADVLYLYDLVEGTVTNPLKFMITPSLKFFTDCFRFNFGSATNLLSRFEMTLVTDPNDPARLLYPESVIWRRKTSYVGGLFAIEYLSIQIVNGAGTILPTAYQAFSSKIPVTIVSSLRDDVDLNERIMC